MLIGAGQLGSRHLQALALTSEDVEITVVDPSPASLDLARQRFGEQPANSHVKTIHFVQDIPAIDTAVDFCVVATNANYRLAALEGLLGKLTVKHLLLEKILFQSCEQLEQASRLIALHNVNTWVNCPRRMFPAYRELQQLLEGETSFALHVNGGNWGLACNAIHFIDLWAFLSGTHSYELNTTGLDAMIIDSKRAGYKELTGTLTGKNGYNTFSLSCSNAESPAHFLIEIVTEHFCVKINEIERTCVVMDKSGNTVKALAYEAPPQSRLTHRVADELLAAGQCRLTPFSESADLHRPFLEGLLIFFNGHGDAVYTACPIT